MIAIQRNKMVIFGAGKIGRSFIGQLFSRGGYELVFVDIYQPIIEELNKRGNYDVIIKSGKEEVLKICPVRGVFAYDITTVAYEVASASLVAVSVGLHGINSIFPTLAKGLVARYEMDNQSAIDIIIAENMRNADTFFYAELKKLLPPKYPIEKLVGLIETSLGKMVPIMPKKDIEHDILKVFAEPYNTLILDKKAFKNPIPKIAGLAAKENIKAWVDRKLFIHNLGHATAAYIGYLYNPGFKYLYEALTVNAIHDFVRQTMLQSADILIRKYPGEFSTEDLTEHIDDLLLRFQNRALGDTIFRVGCDLMRKLGPEDRIAGAIRTALTLNLKYYKILFTLVCGTHFKAKDENGNMLSQDKEFATHCEKGIDHILTTICGFDQIYNSQLFEEAKAIDRCLETLQLKSIFPNNEIN
jgi:mannitol-1-phosphate 5-dehydrogenase